MNRDHHVRGGAAVSVLNRMEAWEANLVLNLRLWCEGPCGQQQVWNEYRKSLHGKAARNECHAFESLIPCLLQTQYVRSCATMWAAPVSARMSVSSSTLSGAHRTGSSTTPPSWLL